MPHSYGADFSAVGFRGPRTLDSTTDTSANPAPSAIMRRIESQPCMRRGLVNDFPSPSPNATTRRSTIIQPMRIAWFTPLAPTRSGIAAYSAEIVPRLAREHAIALVDEPAAHDFVWQHR